MSGVGCLCIRPFTRHEQVAHTLLATRSGNQQADRLASYVADVRVISVPLPVPLAPTLLEVVLSEQTSSGKVAS